MVPLALLWVLFFLSHSLFADNAFKQAAEVILKGNMKYYRLGYNFFSFLFLADILYLMIVLPSAYVFAPGKLSAALGVFLMIAGAIIMIMALSNYDLGEFSGIKQLAQKIHQPEKLVITGINRYVRNPLYTGIIVLVAGYFLYRPSQVNLLSMCMIDLYIYIGATLEERKLAKVFGPEYRAYQQRVKMLLPYIF